MRYACYALGVMGCVLEVMKRREEVYVGKR